ncbi:intraflagellar transport protein 57 homolog isoform X2 [Hoplias malabaricus]|uniref:intraflagellar transport protein 57 homolog isoform X2 n=1 Tax=Hoplias malabaricus TaxID=27720 RepID=UPI0034619BA0
MADEGRRGEDEERGPGAQFSVFGVMEDLLDKLKLLDYEEEVLIKHNMKPLSRHYFVASPYTVLNPGEQFYMFSVISAWLITLCGREFETPQEHDDPNAIVSNILSHLRALGGLVDFPPSKLKSGSGEHVCYVVDRLAEEALKSRAFIWKKPVYPSEELEEESVIEDDAELTLSKVEEITEEPDEEEDVIDLEELKTRANQNEEAAGARPEMILESVTDSAEWNLEVERVLPQLRVTIRSDIKDWRIHVSQMHQHQEGIKTSLKEATGYLDKLLEEISKTQEKVGSREKYINSQLEHLITDYRNAQSKLSEAKDLYQQGSGGVTERTRTLAEVKPNLTQKHTHIHIQTMQSISVNANTDHADNCTSDRGG